MSLYRLQARIDALKRRLPVHYALARMRPFAQQFCEDWQYCVGLGYDPPPFDSLYPVSACPPRRRRIKPFMHRVTDAGFHSRNWADVKKYLERCRVERVYPHQDDILRIALPRAARLELIPPSPDPVTYPHYRQLDSLDEDSPTGAGGPGE